MEMCKLICMFSLHFAFKSELTDFKYILSIILVKIMLGLYSYDLLYSSELNRF